MTAAALAQFVWIVVLLPLLAALATALRMLAGRDAGDQAERPTAGWAIGAAAGGLVFLLALGAAAFLDGLPGQVRAGTWLESGAFIVALSFSLDRASLPLATLVAFIAWVTLRFSASYLHREPGFHRFFLAMNLFVAGMLLIILAGNAVLTFVGWELAGVSSYLLIGYAYDRQTATRNALFAFVTNRVGDAGFVLGIGLAALWLGTTEWSELGAGGTLDPVTARMLLLGFLVAALAKSAQLPFSPWISRALEGPTPSSAIFYGAVMVHAGVFLVIRLEPVLEQVPDVMAYVAAAGLLTALYGHVTGLVQTDVKSALVCATITQVGLMFLECGVGLFDVAAWHLGLHAAWRAYQFLMAPSTLHLVASPAAPAPAWLANHRWLYTAALHRFWIEPIAHGLFTRPTQALGRDMRALDDHVLNRLVGAPSEEHGGGLRDSEVIRGYGLAGRLLVRAADQLHRFEMRLVMRSGDSATTRVLRRIGDAFLVIEALLEQPRYLLLLAMVTFVVIL